MWQAWRVMVEGLEKWGTVMRQNADTLVLDTVEKLAALITEKRASRKVYYEEHQRITNEVSRVWHKNGLILLSCFTRRGITCTEFIYIFVHRAYVVICRNEYFRMYMEIRSHYSRLIINVFIHSVMNRQKFLYQAESPFLAGVGLFEDCLQTMSRKNLYYHYGIRLHSHVMFTHSSDFCTKPRALPYRLVSVDALRKSQRGGAKNELKWMTCPGTDNNRFPSCSSRLSCSPCGSQSPSPSLTSPP